MLLKKKQARIEKWNEICDAFTNALGWDKGLDIVLHEKRSIYKVSILELSETQFTRLRNRLRKAYSVYAKK